MGKLTKTMETTVVDRGCIGIMERNMKTTICLGFLMYFVRLQGIVIYDLRRNYTGGSG